MGWGWGENLRGWGGDGDKPCGDGAGMGKTYLLRGGDGDEIASPCHSLLSSLNSTTMIGLTCIATFAVER